MLIQDEFPDIAIPHDKAALAKLRSLGGIGVVGVQSVDQIHARFGRDEGDALLEQFVSVVAYRVGSRSFEWLQQRAGKTTLLSRQSGQGNLDIMQQCHIAMSLPYTDSTHPEADKLLGKNARNPILQDIMAATLNGLKANDTMSTVTYKLEYDAPVIRPYTQQWLNEPGVALCLLQRGGAPRRDFVKMHKNWR